MFHVRKYDLVIALYIFGVMTAELMGGKTFPLAHLGTLTLTASVAIFVMPLLFTLTDVVVEVDGRDRARSMVLSGLIAATLLALYAGLVTHLPASARFAPNEAAYERVFGTSVRIALASLAAFATSELLDVAVFARLRRRLHGHALWLRNNVSNFISQLADSTVFLTLAFYSLAHSFGANASFLVGLILPYWLIRCGLSVVETPLVYAGVRWLRGSAK